MATVTATPSASVRLKLDLPQHIIDTYERQAEECGVSLEELIAARLCDSTEYTSTKPIYVTDEKRRVLEAILGRNLTSAEDLVKEVRVAASIRVDNVRVALPQDVRKRLTTRHVDKTITYEEHVCRIVRRLLAEFVGR